jgi:hypothetical protein
MAHASFSCKDLRNFSPRKFSDDCLPARVLKMKIENLILSAFGMLDGFYRQSMPLRGARFVLPNEGAR